VKTLLLSSRRAGGGRGRRVHNREGAGPGASIGHGGATYRAPPCLVRRRFGWRLLVVLGAEHSSGRCWNQGG
jgi:hypothetical protein